MSNQSAIWGDLRQRAVRLGLESPTMADAFTAHQANVRAYQHNLRARPDQVGALVYEDDVWRGMETLASAELFGKAWPRILSGYAIDAVGRRPTGQPRELGHERLEELLNASAEVFVGMGAGHDCQFQGPDVVGAALVVGDTVRHVTAFPA